MGFPWQGERGRTKKWLFETLEYMEKIILVNLWEDAEQWRLRMWKI